MRKISFIYFLLATCFVLQAQTSPKKEMRATWITTVWGLDWPANSGKIATTGNQTQINAQKQRIVTLLDAMKGANLNTGFFQVRGRCDAMYNSSYEPWSSDMVATRGLDPGYDPLQFVIEEAHKRGIEIHAWLNPYRFESAEGSWAGQPGDYKATHPEWVLAVAGATILDPGNPEVRLHTKKIIGEIVNNYDVDGIVFDDYFYLSGITSQDSYSQNLYKPSSMAVADWRRANVNQLIADVQDTIKSVKPYVQFGVSPRGIWSTSQTIADLYNVKLPAGITGSNTYADIYCDALAWMKNKTIDYISPQIYWPTTSTGQSYTKLCEWWSNMANLFGVHFYSSQNLADLSGTIPTTRTANTSITYNNETIPMNGLSQLEYSVIQQVQSEEKTKATKAIPAGDFLIQIENNRQFDRNGAPGSVYFRTASFTAQNLRDYFVRNVYQNKALPPAMWQTHPEQDMPSNLRISENVFEWDYTSNHVRYAVYAIPNEEINKAGKFSTADYLLGISYSKSFEILADKPTSAYTYAVAVFDRFNNEFSHSILGKTNESGTPVNLVFPANLAKTVMPFKFTWQAIVNTDYYVFELSTDPNFGTILYQRDITATELSTTDMNFIKEGKYYWRVKSVKEGASIVASDIWSFEPSIFSVTSPAPNEVISATPTIVWASAGSAEHYTVEISTSATFATIGHTAQVSESQYLVPEKKLTYNTVYYIRVKAALAGSEIVSPTIKVTTETATPATPVIITPTTDATVVGTTLSVKWEESPFASLFRIEMHTSDKFSPIEDTNLKEVNAYQYETAYTDVVPGVYYVRVRAYYGSNRTAWSAVHKVNVETDPNSIQGTNQDKLSYYITPGTESQLVISTPNETKVSISIFDGAGKTVANIVKGFPLSGSNNRISLPSKLPSGVYFVRIDTNNEMNTIKWIR